MKMIYGSVFAAAVVALGAVGCNSTGSDGGRAPKPAVASRGQQATGLVAVMVDGDGFSPSKVAVKKGEPVTLRLTRTTDNTCAQRVVFPELKIEQDLPLAESVDISVPTEESRTLAFQCGMGMHKGSVVIN